MVAGNENKRRFGTLISSIIVVLVILVCLVIGLIFLLKVYGTSTKGTLRTGRSVMVHSNALSVSTRFKKDTATIETAGKTIVVKPTQLLIDGKVVAEFDEAVANVSIHVDGGEVSFVADGNDVSLALK